MTPSLGTAHLKGPRPLKGPSDSGIMEEPSHTSFDLAYETISSICYSIVSL